MYLVKDYVGKKNRKGDLGLELEVEFRDGFLDMPNLGSWKAVHEGSIRNGVEFITNGPIPAGNVQAELNWLCNEVKKHHPVMSHRTSFHVHTNVLQYTPTQYWTTACTYWLLENVLFNYFDTYRQGNSFCLRLKDAEGVIGHCIKDLKRGTPFQVLGHDQVRYSAQNLEATRKYGSLERRGMDGTTDAERLIGWTEALWAMDKEAKNYDSPSHMMDDYYNRGPDDFLNRLLPVAFLAKVQKKGWQDQLMENEATICELAYLHSWDKWDKKITKNFDEMGGVANAYLGVDNREGEPPPRPARHRGIIWNAGIPEVRMAGHNAAVAGVERDNG